MIAPNVYQKTEVDELLANITLADGSLTIAKTATLQSALDGKHPNSATSIALGTMTLSDLGFSSHPLGLTMTVQGTPLLSLQNSTGVSVGGHLDCPTLSAESASFGALTGDSLTSPNVYTSSQANALFHPINATSIALGNATLGDSGNAAVLAHTSGLVLAVQGVPLMSLENSTGVSVGGHLDCETLSAGATSIGKLVVTVPTSSERFRAGGPSYL